MYVLAIIFTFLPGIFQNEKLCTVDRPLRDRRSLLGNDVVSSLVAQLAIRAQHQESAALSSMRSTTTGNIFMISPSLRTPMSSLSSLTTGSLFILFSRIALAASSMVVSGLTTLRGLDMMFSTFVL